MSAKYRSIDLFAGIGGIRLGFERAFGDEISTDFVSEWDEFAQITYRANFDTPKGKDGETQIYGDITLDETKAAIPEFDICLAGFPCQAFSMAGRHMGFNDDYKGICRGTLFLDVAEICEKHKPKVIFCENVKGLTIHDKGKTFEVITKTFEKIGYDVYFQILNSKDYGVPQNRERIYIVCFRKDLNIKSFDFPAPTDSSKCIDDIIEENPVSVKYYLSDVYLDTLKKHRARHEAAGHGFGYEVKDRKGISSAIVCGGMGRERNLIVDDRLTDFTPMTHIKGEVNREGIRKMTPREWARLQGFPDDYKLVLADTHLYKQFGNSVTVNVIEAIAKKIKYLLHSTENDADEKEDESVESKRKTKNKGEWSEFYTFAYLLRYGFLQAADKDLNPLDGVRYPLLKITREETANKPIDYYPGETISIRKNGEEIALIPIGVFEKAVPEIFESIKKGEKDNPPGRALMSKCFCNKVSASSKEKKDLFVQAHDPHTGQEPQMGFSIKSYVGNLPTLFNADHDNTNFLYTVKGCTDEIAGRFNSIDTRKKIIDRMNYLNSMGCELVFDRVTAEQFHNNLIMIESKLPDILAEMLRVSYTCKIMPLSDLASILEDEDVLNIGRANFYTQKIRNFLKDVALGMTPAVNWNGEEDANGGYVAVKNDGSVVCYFVYDRVGFMDYLMAHTVIERPSTSRHDYAKIWKTIDGEYKMKLNLQVRFTE